MLLYESAKILHGRQFPLDGDFYDNLFVHFHPIQFYTSGDVKDPFS